MMKVMVMDAVEEIEYTMEGYPTIVAKCWGDSSWPVMLCLHGWLDNASSFDAMAPMLEGWRVIALDHPGHGFSGHFEHFFNYLLAHQMVWLHALINNNFTQPITLLGHSMGACIATLYAGVFPERVARLILLDALGPLTAEFAETAMKLRHSVTNIVGDARPPKTVYPNIDGMIRRRAQMNGLKEHQVAPLVLRGVEKVTGGYQWRFDSYLLLPSPLYLVEGQLADVLTKIACPVQVIMARYGIMTANSRFQRRFEQLADASLEIVEAGHHLHMEQAENVVQLILSQITH